MKGKYALLLTVLAISFLLITEVFICDTFHVYGIVLGAVLSWKSDKIYLFFKNGG